MKEESYLKQNDDNVKNYLKRRKFIKCIMVAFLSITILTMIATIAKAFSLLDNYFSRHNMMMKPIIYLYPEETTKLSVTLGKPENITCSYPNYKDGWNVIANPDGSLVDTNTNRNLYALYWEGINREKPNFDEGFVVKSEDTIKFLEEKLAILGLNERESEEFIVYWLPRMQENKYNLIRFASMEEINEMMPLNFSVQPDTVIRVLMQYKGIDKPIEIKDQKLETPERKGFVAVEWGGTEIN